MKIQTILCIIAYHNDDLQILLSEKSQNYTLPTQFINNDIIKESINFTTEQFNVNVDELQVSILKPQSQIINQQLSIPVIIELNPLQASQCAQLFKIKSKFSWNAFKTLPGKLPQRNLIMATKQYINDQYKLRQLTGIRYLLPSTFTTKSLSTLLTNLTNDYTKRNNIRRKFNTELTIVKKDHSKKGHPVTIFGYKEPKKAGKNHEQNSKTVPNRQTSRPFIQSH